MSVHDKIMIVLLAEYLLLAIAALYGQQHGKAVYWLGALVLSFGVMMQE